MKAIDPKPRTNSNLSSIFYHKNALAIFYQRNINMCCGLYIGLVGDPIVIIECDAIHKRAQKGLEQNGTYCRQIH